MRRPIPAPPLQALLEAHAPDLGPLMGLREVWDPAYRPWEELQRRPLPDGLPSHEVWWVLVQLHRLARARRLPFGGFRLSDCDELRRILARADRQLAGQLGAESGLAPLSEEVTRKRVVLSSLREEAVQSSLLEGASTTRRAATEMLRAQRPPRTHGERMVANNYRAVLFVREHAREPLTLERLLELHRLTTEGTLSAPADEGRLRRDDERVVVEGPEGELLFSPPSAASELPDALRALCVFASTGEPMGSYLHPVERAAVVHFWLAWLHPFVDGNGRVARALFTWVLLREGYWLAEFLAVSKQFRQAPVAYARAFLYAESDERDATYVVLHHLRALDAAVDALDAYVARKQAELAELGRLGERTRDFNLRQRALLRHALQNPGFGYTFASHGGSHEISYPTARDDLMGLEAAGLLVRHTEGRAFVFRPHPALLQRLRGD